eukprot:gene5362-3857_t
MPAPRQGRKGGKIPTATTPESAAQPAAAAAADVVKTPRLTATPEPQAAAEHREMADEPRRSAWSDGMLQIDKDAVQQVGRGSLVRGLRNIQTELHPPVTPHEEVLRKLNEILQKQKPTRYNMKTVLRESMEATSKNSVAIINPNDGHLLAVQLSGEAKTSKVLVVVTHYYEVAETAKVLREMREARKDAPEVGELVGASVQGEKRFNLWVTSAESANLYLCTKGSFAPFTHIIFPALMCMTPLVSFLLFAIRNHLQSTASEEGRVKVIVGTTVRYSEKLCEYFSALEVKSLVNPSTTVDFSYDEGCALGGAEVLKLIGATSQRLPEKKAMRHCAKVAGEILKLVVTTATVPQRIHVFTGDVHPTQDYFASLDIPDTIIWTKHTAEGRMPVGSKAEKHYVYVLSGAECPSLTGYLPPHFVLDLGTMGQQIQPNRDVGFVGGRVTVWTTQEELEEHHSLVCPGGGYFRLFPELSDERPESSVSYSVYEVETALLQSARTNIPNNEALIFRLPPDVMENTISNLSDNCLTVPPSDLTFTGEMASRLPLGTDLVTFIIHSCAMGLGEPAVVVASVCALSMRRRMGKNEEETAAWAAKVLASRKAYAPRLLEESDLLADAAVFLEWHRRCLQQNPTAAVFPEEIGVPLARLQSIRTLLAHLVVQLSDYVFLGDMDDPAVVEQVQEKLVSCAPLIAVTYGVSSSRRALVVRETGATTKDRSATLAFVRTAKKVFPSPAPSAVPWETLSVLIAADIRTDTSDRGFEGYRFTYLSASFYNAALLLLYPSVVYSAPQNDGGSEQMVFFGISCNGHRKRYRVPLSQASLLLRFRDKWNVGLGYLHALRVLPRPISRGKFFRALRETDRCFHLDNFYEELQRELLHLVMDLDVYEYHGSFDMLHEHFLCPNVLVSFPDTEASDCVIAKEFESTAAWPVTLSRGTTPAADIGNVRGAEFPIQDDDVENYADLYFLHHGPIVDGTAYLPFRQLVHVSRALPSSSTETEDFCVLQDKIPLYENSFFFFFFSASSLCKRYTSGSSPPRGARSSAFAMEAEVQRIQSLMREDEASRSKGGLLQHYSEEQRRNLYGGRAPGPSASTDGPRRGCLPHQSRYEFHPGPVALAFPEEDEIDRLMRQDDRERGGIERVAEMSPAARAQLYAGSSSAIPLVKSEEEQRRVSKGRGGHTQSYGHLSNFRLDGIPEPRTEGDLLQEYERSKREQYVMEVVAEEGSEDDFEDDDVETRIARKEARQFKEQEKRRKDLYERIRCAKKQMQATGSSMVKTDPKAPTFSYSNSKIPGPYLTINQKGEHTRFEALHNRFHMHRSPQRVWSRNEALHLEDASPRASLYSPKSKGKKDVDLDIVLETGETERLRRWKHRMGLSEGVDTRFIWSRLPIRTVTTVDAHDAYNNIHSTPTNEQKMCACDYCAGITNGACRCIVLSCTFSFLFFDFIGEARLLMAKKYQRHGANSVGVNKAYSMRHPDRDATNEIPPEIRRRMESALQQVKASIDTTSSGKVAQVVAGALEKLCDAHQTQTPELQIRALSRITGAIKGSEHVQGTSFARAIAHDFVVPCLLDSRVRYLHRGLTTLLRAVCQLTEEVQARIKAAFLQSLDKLCVSEKGTRCLYPRDGAQNGAAEYKDAVMTLLNKLDSLSSTLLPFAPSVFADTFICVLPLLGDSLLWCVHSATSTSRYKELESSADGVTSAVLGEDLERIRFGVRVVASYVHKFMDHIAESPAETITPHLTRLLEPAVAMLCSYTFPKDVLNATGLLVASATTVKHCSKAVIMSMCTAICTTDTAPRQSPNDMAATSEAIHQGLSLIVRCFCTPTEELSGEQAEAVRHAMHQLFSQLTTHGRFALLKGMLAHFSSPVRGQADTLRILLGVMEDGNSKGQCILYDLILPLSLTYYRAVDVPETRFMAIQTIDCAVRHAAAVLQHLRSLSEAAESIELAQLRRSCVVPHRLMHLIGVATQLTMEVWDDSTTQVSGALYDTYNVVLSLNKLVAGFCSEYPALVGAANQEVAPLDLPGTLQAVLAIQAERRGKYHALLGLMSSMPASEFLSTLCTFYHCDGPNAVEDAMECFSRALLHCATNHKVASVAGDTLSRLVSMNADTATVPTKGAEDCEETASHRAERGKARTTRVLTCVARAMLEQGYTTAAGNVSAANHIAHISAHFIGPLLKQSKALFHDLLDIISHICRERHGELEEERISQGIIEVLTRARGNGIDIQAQLEKGSATLEVVLQSLQNHKFEQRIAALSLCVFPSKKAEVLPWQAAVVEQFVTLNMHLGGDSAARKAFLETFRKWVKRVVESFPTPQSPQAGHGELESLLQHVKRLVDIFETNIGWDIVSGEGRSVERKVAACGCYASFIRAVRETPAVYHRLQPVLFRGDVIRPLLNDLADGWSQMRLAAAGLLGEFVADEENLKHFLSIEMEPSAAVDRAFRGALSATTLREAEGAVHRYMLWVRVAAAHDHRCPKPIYPEVLSKTVELLDQICSCITSQHGASLFEYITDHPLHGSLSLCAELFTAHCNGRPREDTTTVLPMANRLFHLCASVIRACGALAGHDVPGEEEVVDCRGHAYDRNHDAPESAMRFVVNNTWLGIRVATLCLQRVITLVDITGIEYSTVESMCYDLTNALLLTKHNGIMRCVRGALKVLVQALVRCRSSAFYHLPSQLLSFLLGPDGVSSTDISRMLRRSQGLPHALLAVLEAEDDSAPPVLFPVAMRTLLQIGTEQRGSPQAQNPVRLSQRSNALNVLKFIFEDKIFGERVVADVEAALMMATNGFDHSSWNIRNSSLMLFAAVLQRFVGEHPATGGSGVNTSLHDIAKRTPRGVAYAYQELHRSLEVEASPSGIDVRDLTTLPLLQMLSMLAPDPPHIIAASATGGYDGEAMIHVVSQCSYSRNLMIRAASAVALPCLVPPANIGELLRRISQRLTPADAPRTNTIHGVLLQLQHFHSSYVGTLRRKQRMVQSPYATPETAATTTLAVADVIVTGSRQLEAAALVCPTVCSCLHALIADVLAYGVACHPPAAWQARLTALLGIGVRTLSNVLEKPTSLFRWSNADHAGTLEAAALFLLFALEKHDQMEHETLEALRRLGEVPGATALLTPEVDRVHSFPAVLARQLHTYYSESFISAAQLRSTVGLLSSLCGLNVCQCALEAAAAAVEHFGGLCSWHLVAGSDCMGLLADLSPLRCVDVPEGLRGKLLASLSSCVMKGTFSPEWCTSGLRLLAATSGSESAAHRQQLIESLEFFGMPQRPQTMRLATLDCLAHLLLGVAGTLRPGHAPSPSAPALLLTLLCFLLDDSYDVRERASSVCCRCLAGANSMVSDPVTCALGTVLVLKRLYVSGLVEKAEVVRRLGGLLEDDEQEGTADAEEADVLFFKESDNMFVEDAMVSFYMDIMLGSSEAAGGAETKERWRTLSEMARSSQDGKQSMLPRIVLSVEQDEHMWDEVKNNIAISCNHLWSIRVSTIYAPIHTIVKLRYSFQKHQIHSGSKSVRGLSPPYLFLFVVKNALSRGRTALLWGWHAGAADHSVRPVSEDTVNPLEKPAIIDKGVLHVVSVPVGNLKDFTFRAIDVLREVDYVVTSDRPATKTLLDLVMIPNQGRLIHYSPQNRSAAAPKLVEMLKGGRSMALVTTSGTPCIGDVGGELVRAMLASGVRVTAVPGASAVLSALSSSGETSSAYEHAPRAGGPDASVDAPMMGAFFFGNLMPSGHAARLRLLRNVVGPATHPCVFYEVPRRLLLVLEDIASVLPNRRVHISHELTKLNESAHADRVERLVAFYRRTNEHQLLKLGQLVIIICAASPADTAMWLNKIVERRRRFRMDVPAALEGNKVALSGSKTGKGKKKKLSSSRRRRKRRLALLQQIQLEQERLRMSLSANRGDAQKVDTVERSS